MTDPCRVVIKRGARALLHGAGCLRGVRWWNRSGFRILMYHHFPASARDSLEKQCSHIQSHYQPVTMTEIGRALSGGAPLPRHALAVTVDDGYRDFLNAAPVFRAHAIPVLVYLTSGFIDGATWFWWDKAAYAVSQTRRARFQASLIPGAPGVSLASETEEQRRSAASAVIEAMKALPSEHTREAMLADLLRATEVELPGSPPPGSAPLSWDEARLLASAGVEFGAHTITHPILATLGEPEALSREIGGSKERIESQLGSPVLHFCYPCGRRRDFDEKAAEAARQCGFLTATTAEFGLNGSRSCLMRLRRFGVEPGMDEEYFKEMLAGLHGT